jgi:hypothetical protein
MSILYLAPARGGPPGGLAGAVRALWQYDLAGDILAGAAALLIPHHADQRHLAHRRGLLDGFLAAGGALVVCGQPAYPFLAGLATFEPLATMTRATLTVAIVAPHPVLDGVAADDLTYRRGVAGFWGRGQVPPPAGARVLTTLDSGRVPLDWELAVPGGGRLLVHPGNDLWGYAAEPTTAARLVPNLLRWLAA